MAITLKKTKSIRPVDIAALNLLTDHDDVVAYVNALMQVDSPENTEQKLWFPKPENPGDESEHTPIQQRILRERRELQKLEQLDPKQENALERSFFQCLNGTTH